MKQQNNPNGLLINNTGNDINCSGKDIKVQIWNKQLIKGVGQ
jgi:hypothetical protein